MAKLQLAGKVVGHKLRKIVVRGPRKTKSTFERMAVTMEFEDDETGKPTQAVFLMAVSRAKSDFEICDPVSIDMEVRQQKLNLKGGRSAAARAH